MKEFPVNEQIVASKVHLIMNDGRSAGVVSIDQARYLAAQHGLDLVEINSSTKEPIVKLLNYNKYRYQQEKQLKGTVKKTNQLKEIRLGFSTDEHDLETKAKKAREFLESGHFVRVYLQMRGRENIFVDKAKQTLLAFQQRVGATIEQPITHLGKKVQLIIKPKKG